MEGCPKQDIPFDFEDWSKPSLKNIFFIVAGRNAYPKIWCIPAASSSEAASTALDFGTEA